MRTKSRGAPRKKPMTVQIELDRPRSRGYLASIAPEGYVFRDVRKGVATYVLAELVAPPDKIAQAIGNFYAAKRRVGPE